MKKNQFHMFLLVEYFTQESYTREYRAFSSFGILNWNKYTIPFSTDNVILKIYKGWISSERQFSCLKYIKTRLCLVKALIILFSFACCWKKKQRKRAFS